MRSLLLATSIFVLTLGCGAAPPSGVDAGDDAGVDAGAGQGGGTGGALGGGGGSGGGASGGGAGGGASTTPASFTFTPSWDGVTAVDVVGAFGDGGAWSTLTHLAPDGAGRWSGSAALPEGTYAYLYRVAGDAQGPPGLERNVVDPSNPLVDACPTDSPTYNERNVNPCSLLQLPQGSAAPTYTVSGKVQVDGVGATGYLVVIEREEPTQHHFIADRATTASSGEYAFKVAAGHWRLQVWYPTWLTQTDAQRAPLVLQAFRRSLTNAFPVAAAVTVGPAELGFHQYEEMLPNDGGSFALPQSFAIPRSPWAASAHFAIYGSKDGGSNNIGDPWATSPGSDGGRYTFDGAFTTKQALEVEVRLTERYFWGTVQNEPRDGGANWSAESMVFPVSFH